MQKSWKNSGHSSGSGDSENKNHRIGANQCANLQYENIFRAQKECNGKECERIARKKMRSLESEVEKKSHRTHSNESDGEKKKTQHTMASTANAILY